MKGCSLLVVWSEGFFSVPTLLKAKCLPVNFVRNVIFSQKERERKTTFMAWRYVVYFTFYFLQNFTNTQFLLFKYIESWFIDYPGHPEWTIRKRKWHANLPFFWAWVCLEFFLTKAYIQKLTDLFPHTSHGIKRRIWMDVTYRTTLHKADKQFVEVFSW